MRRRPHLWWLLTALTVLGSLTATVEVVRVEADKKDGLRQAQVALAAAPAALHGVLGSPQSLLAGERFSPIELTMSRRLRGELATATTQLTRFWHAPEAQNLAREGALVNARTEALMRLLARHRLREANALNDAAIQPIGNRLRASIVTVRRALDRAITASDRTSWRATLAAVGIAGVLLLVLVFGLASGRRRRLRAELEQSAARDSERRFRALVEHSSDIIAVVEPDATVIYQAGAVRSVLGCAPAELQGASLKDLVHPGDLASLMELCATTSSSSRELRLRRSDGTHRTCEVHATCLRGDSAWEGIVLNIWDLSERKALEEKLRHQAFHDTLTGLPNRALILDRAEQMLARARRTRAPVAAVYVDIDGFKHVNDTFGHAAGDELLQTVAERLTTVLREGDTAGRFGGDEFIVLIEDATREGAPTMVADRLLKVLRQPYQWGGDRGRQLPVTASIGIALGIDGTADELLRDADAAMYEAKVGGRNGCKIFEAGMQDSLSGATDARGGSQPDGPASAALLPAHP